MINEIELKTSDTSLITDLKAENIIDLKVAQQLFICNSAELADTTEKIITIIVTLSSTAALNISWRHKDYYQQQLPNNSK